METALKFCKSILPKVSRSFALTIPMLDRDLYRPVLITYLQDRLLDNFEDEIDSQDISLDERMELMDQVVELFNPASERVEGISARLKKYAPLMPENSLRQLTENAALIREAYDSLEESIKLSSYKWLQEMNRGMKKYLTVEIETFTDLDDYCYYVAGTVGGFLTDIILIKRELNQDDTLKLLDNFNDAGIFLQKINLVRDIKKDIKNREKNFWPLKSLGLSPEILLNPAHKELAMEALAEMLGSIKAHISNLITYLEALPESLSGYKRFFCVNNALGLATIEKLENNPAVFYGNQEVKVSKLEFLKILKSPERVFYERAASLQKV